MQNTQTPSNNRLLKRPLIISVPGTGLSAEGPEIRWQGPLFPRGSGVGNVAAGHGSALLWSPLQSLLQALGAQRASAGTVNGLHWPSGRCYWHLCSSPQGREMHSDTVCFRFLCASVRGLPVLPGMKTLSEGYTKQQTERTHLIRISILVNGK